MRIITVNVNGIRAAARKGFFDWLSQQRADVVCIQETKAQFHQLGDEVFHPAGYHCFYEDAEKKGYSGVAIYSKHEPRKVIRGYGDPEFDAEGRYLEAQLGGLSVVSLYLPSGSSSEERQAAKYRCMDSFTEHLHKLRRRRSEVIICGDWNIAHKEIDLKNWRSNQKNSGCSASTGGSMRFARSSRSPMPIPGGPTAAGRGIRTWAGASTITWFPRGWRTRCSAPRFTRTSDFPITRR